MGIIVLRSPMVRGRDSQAEREEAPAPAPVVPDAPVAEEEVDYEADDLPDETAAAPPAEPTPSEARPPRARSESKSGAPEVRPRMHTVFLAWHTCVEVVLPGNCSNASLQRACCSVIRVFQPQEKPPASKRQDVKKQAERREHKPAREGTQHRKDASKPADKEGAPAYPSNHPKLQSSTGCCLSANESCLRPNRATTNALHPLRSRAPCSAEHDWERRERGRGEEAEARAHPSVQAARAQHNGGRGQAARGGARSEGSAQRQRPRQARLRVRAPQRRRREGVPPSHSVCGASLM